MDFRMKAFTCLIFVVSFTITCNLAQQITNNDEKTIQKACLRISKGLKLQVKGKDIKLSDVDINECGEDVRYLEFFATDKVLIDADLKLVGKEVLVAIIAPVWEIRGNREIVLDGYAALDHNDDQAKNGTENGNKDGAYGLAGMPGGPAGSFYGVANEIINAQQLSVSANGGKGGKGQNGGNGARGQVGEEFETEVKLDCDDGPFDCDNGKAVGWVVEGIRLRRKVKNYFDIFGKEGKRGGNGGHGGVGGQGGYQGHVLLFQLASKENKNNPKISMKDGNNGDAGFGGINGIGGKAGRIAHYKCVTSPCNLGSKIEEYYDSEEIAEPGRPGKNGLSVKMRNVTKTAQVVQNFPYTLNEYKKYARFQMANNNRTKEQLKTFYDSLNTRQEITAQYDTFALIADFTALEQQYFLNSQFNLTSSYSTLEKRFEAYITKLEEENNKEHKDIIKNVCDHLKAKITTLNSEKIYPLMTDILLGFETYVSSPIEQFNEQKKIDTKLGLFQDRMNPLEDLIKDANHLMNGELLFAMRDLETTLDQNIDSILIEISDLTNKTNEKRKELIESRTKLKNTIALKGVLGFMQVVCGVLGVMNPALGLATGAASAGLALIDTSLTRTDTSGKLQEVSKTFLTLQNSTVDFLKNEKYAMLKIQSKYIEDLRKVSEFAKDKIDYVLNRVENAKNNLPWNRNDVFDQLDTELGIKKEEAKQHNLDREEQSYEIAINVVKYLKVTNEVLKSGSETVSSILSNKEKIDKIDSAINANRQTLARLNNLEKKVYQDTQPMLYDMINLAYNASNALTNMNGNNLTMNRWKVIETIKKVEHSLTTALQNISATDSMLWTLEKLTRTFKIMNEMHEGVLKYGEMKNETEYLLRQNLVDQGKLLTTNIHLTKALTNLKTVLFNNTLYESAERWLFAFKQFAFPYGGQIIEMLKESKNSANRDLSPVAALIKDNGSEFIKALKSSELEHSLLKRAEKVAMGNGDQTYPAFYVWKNEKYSGDIRQLLLGREAVLISRSKRNDYNALKFNQIQILLTSKDPETQKNLNQVLKNYRVNLIHSGSSVYKFKNNAFIIQTKPVNFTYRFLNDFHETLTKKFEKGEDYKKVVNGDHVLSPYSLWRIKLIDDRGQGFEPLKEFIRHVDLELVGVGEYLENIDCDERCEDIVFKYYGDSFEIKQSKR